MPDRTQEIKNLRQVFTASVNYTDNKIKKVYYDIGHNDISTEDHTNEATYRFTAPANAKLLMLQSIAGNSAKYSPSVASDTTSAYQKTIPSYSPSIDRASASMNILGGMNYKVNQLIGNGNFTTINYWSNITRVENNQGVLQGNSAFNYFFQTNNAISGHKYLCIGTIKSDTLGIGFFGDANGSPTYFNIDITAINTWELKASIFTASSNMFRLAPLRMGSYSGSETYTAYAKNVMLFDLTAMGIDTTDVATATSELLKRGIDITQYNEYNTGSIRDSAVTSVVSKDSNDTTIDTLTIDSNIQALDGYGWGINDTCYNYIDFNAKKFIKKVGKILGSSVMTLYKNAQSEDDWLYYFSIAGGVGSTVNNQIICNKLETKTLPPTGTNTGCSITSNFGGIFYVNLYGLIQTNDVATALAYIQANLEFIYPLPSVIEIDISQYLDGNEIENEPNGTLSFESTYSAYVPSNVSYNGTIIHSLATAVKQDGFNVWDEEYEVGEIADATGQNVSSSSVIRSKNYISVMPNSILYFKTPQTMTVYQYDSNKNFLGQAYNFYGSNNTKTLESNCAYIRFKLVSTYGTTYKNDICINISNQDLNGTYKPYKAPVTRLLPNSEAKYSWGITDGVRNTRIFCDDEGNPVNEGSLVVGNQDLGGLNYTYEDSTYHIFSTPIPSNMKAVQLNKLCANYTITSNTNWDRTDKTLSLNGSLIKIIIKDMNFSNATIFKTSNNGVPLFYQKNTTDTETLDDFDFSFDCEEGDTFTLVNTEQLQCYATYSFLIKEAKSNE